MRRCSEFCYNRFIAARFAGLHLLDVCFSSVDIKLYIDITRVITNKSLTKHIFVARLRGKFM